MLGRMKEHTLVADLFCAAGGLSAGLLAAGCRIVHAADCDPTAVQSYRLNFRHEAALENLHWNSTLPDTDVVVGGPPCQGFSSAGKRNPNDARNSLVAVFAHLVARHRPQAFLFENVEGFLTGDEGRWVVDLLDPLITAGYCIHMRKINAANYGVPQHRKRVIALGGLGWNPGFRTLRTAPLERLEHWLSAAASQRARVSKKPCKDCRRPCRESADNAHRWPITISEGRGCGASSRVAPGPDDEGSAGVSVAQHLPATSAATRDGRDTKRTPRRGGRWNTTSDAKPTVKGDYERRQLRVHPSDGGQTAHVARVRPFANLRGRLSLRGHVGGQGNADCEYGTSTTGRTVRPSPAGGDASLRVESGGTGPQVIPCHERDSHEPGVATHGGRSGTTLRAHRSAFALREVVDVTHSACDLPMTSARLDNEMTSTPRKLVWCIVQFGLCSGRRPPQGCVVPSRTPGQQLDTPRPTPR